MIDQVYPSEFKRDLAAFLREGPMTIVANPGACATELVTAISPDLIVLRARDAGTPAGFRMQFARGLLNRATARLSLDSASVTVQQSIVAMLAVPFGRRAPDVYALANGEFDRDVTFAELAHGVPEDTVVVIDDAHLVDSVAGRETLWGLRDHRRVVLVTRPWFVEKLRRSDAAFFGHGRTLSLSSVRLRPPVDDPADAAFVAEMALDNAEVTLEIIRRGEGDVRRGWAETVEARLAVSSTLLRAAFALHQLGPRLLRAIAADDPPYGAVSEAPSQRIAKALRVLRDSDLIYPPRPRRWRLADPALAAALRARDP